MQDPVELRDLLGEMLHLSSRLNQMRARIDFPKSHFLYYALKRCCELGHLEMAICLMLQIKLVSPQAYVRVVDAFAFEALLEGCWRRGAADYFINLLERMVRSLGFPRPLTCSRRPAHRGRADAEAHVRARV